MGIQYCTSPAKLPAVVECAAGKPAFFAPSTPAPTKHAGTTCRSSGRTGSVTRVS